MRKVRGKKGKMVPRNVLFAEDNLLMFTAS